MEKYELGLNKKSFSLYYHGGEIWCEHLDALCDKTEWLKRKFSQDLVQMRKPSASAFVAVNVDETAVNDEILRFILDGLISLKRPAMKIVFVGLDAKMKRRIKSASLPFAVHCIDDFEKAKEWLIH